MAGKYDRLSKFLETEPSNEVTLTFTQLEEIIGEKLPESARRHPAWWGNDAKTHAQAQAWMEYGWRSKGIDLPEERVTFVRVQ